MHTQSTALALVFIVFIVFSGASNAATTVFTDRTVWESVAIGEQTENFNSVAPGILPSTAVTAVGLLSIETINTIISSGGTGIFDGTNDRNTDGTNHLQLGLDGEPVRAAAIIFPQPVVAWAMDYNERDIFDDTEITFADIDQSIFSLTGSHSGFVGFVSDTLYTRVDFSDPFISFAEIGIDNVSFAPTVVPLPSSAWLFISSLASFGLVAKIKQRRRVAA